MAEIATGAVNGLRHSKAISSASVVVGVCNMLIVLSSIAARLIRNAKPIQLRV